MGRKIGCGRRSGRRDVGCLTRSALQRLSLRMFDIESNIILRLELLKHYGCGLIKFEGTIVTCK
jgi:hypothetical protein